MKLATARRVGAWIGALLWLALATPPLRRMLESSMTTHMLVQMPLLAASGCAAACALPASWRERAWHRAGGSVPLVLAAMLAASWWMLPRALDAALDDRAVELAKFASLPLLVGAPLALAWPRLGIVGRGFVWTNLASMLAVVGWLYIAAPLRVCNRYLISAQSDAGAWMIVIAIAIMFGWLLGLFVGPPRTAAGSTPESESEQGESPGDNGAARCLAIARR